MSQLQPHSSTFKSPFDCAALEGKSLQLFHGIQSTYSAIYLFCFVVDVMQVRSPGQRRGVADAELRACAVPHAVPDGVGAVECVLCDGHAGHEEGE